MPADHPREVSELESEQRKGEARVACDHERPALSRHAVQLVEGKQAGDEREAEEPPAAQVDEADDDRQEDRSDEDPRERAGSHRAPNLRPRRAYSSSAARSSSSPKSGQ